MVRCGNSLAESHSRLLRLHQNPFPPYNLMIIYNHMGSPRPWECDLAWLCDACPAAALWPAKPPGALRQNLRAESIGAQNMAFVGRWCGITPSEPWICFCISRCFECKSQNWPCATAPSMDPAANSHNEEFEGDSEDLKVIYTILYIV